MIFEWQQIEWENENQLPKIEVNIETDFQVVTLVQGFQSITNILSKFLVWIIMLIKLRKSIVLCHWTKGGAKI